jgi:hypothetical protein
MRIAPSAASGALSVLVEGSVPTIGADAEDVTPALVEPVVVVPAVTVP